MLLQYGQAKSKKEEVEILLNHINTKNPQLVSTIQICRSSFSNNFLQDSTYLSTQIAKIFPPDQPGSDKRRVRGQGNARGQGNGNRRQVNKVVKKNRKSTFNAVDVTDTKSNVLK